MDWIKIKPRHILYSPLNDKEGYALIKLQCLTANVETMPTEAQMLKVVHRSTLSALKQSMMNCRSGVDEVSMKCRRTLDEVLMKVLEDVDGIQHKKEISRGTTKRYREKVNVGDASPDTTEKRREEKRRVYKKKTSRVTFTPPTLEEVKTYCKERNNNVDPDKWHDFYTSKGWMVGKNQMKDWHAAIRTWEKESGMKPKKSVVMPVSIEKPDPKERAKVAEMVKATAKGLHGESTR